MAAIAELPALDAEGRRAAEEGLSEEEYALFCLLERENLSKSDREHLKLASKSLLEAVQKLVAPLERWTEKEQTQAEVKRLILDHVFTTLPDPPYSDVEKQAAADRLFEHFWRLSASGGFASASVV